jgi:hypothetical protein
VLKLKKAAREAKAKRAESETARGEVGSLAGQEEHLEKSLRRGEERHEELQRMKYISDEASSRAATTLRRELSDLNAEIARAREARRAADARKAVIDGEVRQPPRLRWDGWRDGCRPSSRLSASPPALAPAHPVPHAAPASPRGLQKERAQTRHQAEMADMLASMKAVQRSVMEYHVRLANALAEAAQPVPGAGGSSSSMMAAGGGSHHRADHPAYGGMGMLPEAMGLTSMGMGGAASAASTP